MELKRVILDVVASSILDQLTPQEMGSHAA